VFVADTAAVKIIVQEDPQSCNSAWHHLALTHGDGTVAATKTYLDGALIATSQRTLAIPSDGTAMLTVNWNAGPSSNSAGAVSDVRLYRRALSAAEVLALSQPPLARANTVVVPPVPVQGVSFYSFSCAAGSAGTAGFLAKSAADNSWSWSPAQPACVACAAGSWAPQGTTACTLCPPGTYSSAGASSCLPCPAGTYGSSAGLASSTCTGTCASTTVCPLGTAYPPPAAPITDLSCASSGARAVPSSLGVLLWPAANPSNPQHVDLIIAPLAMCQQLTSSAACATAASITGLDGVLRFVVGTAAALNLEAAEALTCSVK